MHVDLEKAKELRQQGKTFKEISLELGCSEGYIRNKLSGIPRGREEYDATVVDDLNRIARELKDIADLLKK